MSKKASERIFFKNRGLVEQYRVANPNVILTRFIKDEADIYPQESKAPKAEKPAEPEVPEVA